MFTSAVVAVVRLVLLRQLRLKVQALERQSALDRERTRIARDIHDDIGNLLTQVTLLSSLTQRDRGEPEKTGEHARQISSTVEQVTNSLDEIVWAVNPPAATHFHAVDRLHRAVRAGVSANGGHPVQSGFAGPSAASRGAGGCPAQSVSRGERSVEQCGPAFGRKAEVSLRITVTEQGLEVTIQDNGRSFDVASVNGSGNGLRNIRQRMDELGGRFEVRSRIGAGTQILLNVPQHGRNSSNGHGLN